MHLKIRLNLFLLLLMMLLPASEIKSGRSSVYYTDAKRDNPKHFHTSGIKEIYISGVMHADLHSVITALNDVANYPKWVNNCVKSYKFKVLNDSDFHYYTRTDLPFPLSDRDLVVHTRQAQTPDGVWHSISTAQPDAVEENSGVVRIKTYRSEWKMKALTAHTIHYDYKIILDPGGYIPDWIVNIAQNDAIHDALKELEKRSIVLMHMK